MDDKSTILVVSTVPTTGYLIMSGLVDLALYVLMAVLAYYLLKKAGIDMLSILGGYSESDNKSKNSTPKGRPAQTNEFTAVPNTEGTE